MWSWLFSEVRCWRREGEQAGSEAWNRSVNQKQTWMEREGAAREWCLSVYLLNWSESWILSLVFLLLINHQDAGPCDLVGRRGLFMAGWRQRANTHRPTATWITQDAALVSKQLLVKNMKNKKLLQCVGAIGTKQPSSGRSREMVGVSPNSDFISHYSCCFLPPLLLHGDFKARLIIVSLLPPSVVPQVGTKAFILKERDKKHEETTTKMNTHNVRWRKWKNAQRLWCFQSLRY